MHLKYIYNFKKLQYKTLNQNFFVKSYINSVQNKRVQTFDW